MLADRSDLAIDIQPTCSSAERLKALGRLVGNTPLLAVEFRFCGRRRVLYAKSEHMNMTGSIKDRMALHILYRAYQEGRIRSGDTIVEASSGNTGIAFAALGRALGHPVVIYMPDWMSRERLDLVRSFGAQVVSVTHEEGGFFGSIRMAEGYKLAHRHVFLPRQFSNQANTEAHEKTTGPELWWQLRLEGLSADAFVAGVGTGGTVMGVGRFLRSKDPKVRVHPVEPAESPTLSTGCHHGKHRIQGISDEFVPALMDLSSLNEVISVHDGDAILMAQKLAAAGLAVGISSGANFVAALKAQEMLGGAAVVATVFADDNKKYLSTDLLRQEPVRDEYLSAEVEVTGFRAFKRVCEFCCEMYEATEQSIVLR